MFHFYLPFTEGSPPLFEFDPTILLQIVLRTSMVYVFLLLLLRFTGKRELGQLNPLDLVLILVLSNSVQNAMTGPDVSVTGGIVAASTLVLINAIFAFSRSRNEQVEHFFEGTPTTLVRRGQVDANALHKERLTRDELAQALREHGVEDITECQLAMLEVDGSISVISGQESTKPLPQYIKKRRRFVQKQS